jgi:hypothetical protein
MHARWLLPLAALALAAPSSVQAAVPAAVQRVNADAARLAALLIPEDQLLASVDVAFTSIFDAKLAQDPAAKALFARDPGMRDVIWKAARPEVLRMIHNAIPAYRADLAEVLTRELAPDDLRGLADFLASPTGNKFYNWILQAIAEQAGTEMDRNAAVQGVLARMTPAEIREINRFAATHAAGQMNRLAALTKPVGERQKARMMESDGERLRQVVRDAMTAYLAGKDKPQ